MAKRQNSHHLLELVRRFGAAPLSGVGACLHAIHSSSGGAGFTPAICARAELAGIKPAPPYGIRTIRSSLLAFFAVIAPLSAPAATLTPPPAAPQIQLQPDASAPPASELPKIVEQLAAQPSLSAADCAKLARETITHGQAARQSGQPAKPAIIHDGIAAVDQGEATDAKAADWPELRAQLLELLKPPPPQDKKDDKKDDEKKEEQKKDEQQKQQDQQKDPQKPQDKNQEQKPPEQPQSEQQKKEQEKKQQEQQQQAEPQKPDKPEPPKDTQSVGGEKPKDDERKEHPELAMPLQKLDQVRDKDSPAELFQLLQNDEPPPPGQPKKDW